MIRRILLASASALAFAAPLSAQTTEQGSGLDTAIPADAPAAAPAAKTGDAVLDRRPDAGAGLGDAGALLGDVGDDALRRVRRGGRPVVRDQVEQRGVGLVPDRGHQGRAAGGGRADEGLVAERQQVLDRPSAARHDDDLDPRVGVQLGDGPADLRHRADALHRDLADDELHLRPPRPGVHDDVVLGLRLPPAHQPDDAGQESTSRVVVKVLRPQIVRKLGASATNLIRKEAVALGRLNERTPPTPFVVRLVDTGEAAVVWGDLPVHLPWIALEYVHGGPLGTTLLQRVKQSLRQAGHAFDPRRAAHALESIASGLSAVHEVGALQPGERVAVTGAVDRFFSARLVLKHCFDQDTLTEELRDRYRQHTVDIIMAGILAR